VERAYPQTMRSVAARRAWQVDIRPDTRRLACTAPDCPATAGLPSDGQGAQQAALGHLAAHAQHEPLDQHLRTCRCHAHGCTWHPRHRGCDGPVALTVFRSRGGATWQLADTCTACIRTIPHAAQLPQRSGPEPSRRRLPVRPSTAAPSRSGGLQPLLTYLDAALLPGTSPRARLVALLCLLRADRDGTIRLPTGLLRAWRLADDAEDPITDLVHQRWLRERAAGTRGTLHALAVADGAASRPCAPPPAACADSSWTRPAACGAACPRSD
jgi:hypothetical protein